MAGINISIGLTGLEQLQKAVTLLEKSGKAGDDVVAGFKGAQTSLQQFVGQVKALQTPLSEMATLYQKGGTELQKLNTRFKESIAQSAATRGEINALITTYKLWGGTMDVQYSKQYKLMVLTKAEGQVTNNLNAIAQKTIAIKAEEIALTDAATIAANKVLAIGQADLALKKARLGADINYAKQLTVNTILHSEETLAIKQQALAYAGIPPLKMAVAAATKELISSELAYTAAAVQSSAQVTKRGMALELLSAQDKKRAALLSELNALENGYTASLARSLAPLEARVALAQAKNAVDIAAAKQMTVNAILQSKETLEIKQQALVYAGIPPLKMAVAAATEAEAAAANASAGANVKSAGATTAAGRAAGGAAGAFTTYGSAVRGAVGAMGMLWFAYGQLLPLMIAFAAVRGAKEAMALGVAFEYTTTSIQSLSKDVEGAVMPLEKIQEALLGMEGLRHTPTELAEGMREFAKAGIAPAEALRDLETMSKFATIAEMGLGEAIKDVIGLTLAFQPTMEAATGKMFTFADAANMLAAAAMLSITDVDEMSTAFAHAAELGIVSGMRFEEVAASLAIMANAGIRGTKAATSLRTGMLKLQTAGDPVHKMFKDLGRSFNAFNEDGSVKNVIETFKELNRATAGLADKERIEIFTKLFTARSMKAGAVLSQQVGELDKFIEKLKEAAEGVGFIEQKYQDLGATAGAEWDYLKVEVEKSMLSMVNTEWLAGMISETREFVHEAAPDLKTALSDIKSVIDVLYDSVKFFQDLGGPSVGEWGIIGYALLRGGPQAAAVVLALSTIYEILSRTGHGLGDFRDKWEAYEQSMGVLLRSLSDGYDEFGNKIAQLSSAHDGVSSYVTEHIYSIHDLANMTQISVNQTVAAHDTFLQSLNKLSAGLAAFYGSGFNGGGVGGALTPDEQALYDRLLPLQKAQKDFAAGLVELDALAKKTNMSTTDYGIALDNLKKSTIESSKFTKESTRTIKEHNTELEQHEKLIQSTVDKYLPLKKSKEDAKEAVKLLTEAFKNEDITSGELVIALDNVKRSTEGVKEQVDKIRESYKAWDKEQEEAQKFARDQSKTYAQIYADLADSSQEMSVANRDAQIAGLNDQLIGMRQYVKDEDLLRQWREMREQEIWIKWAKGSNDFFAGFKAASLEAGDILQGLGKLGADVYTSLADTFHDTAYAVLKGDFESIGDLWDSLLDKMLNMFIDWIASMVARWAMAAIGEMIAGAFSGSGWGGLVGGVASMFGGGSGGGFGAAGSAASLASTAASAYTWLTGGGTAAAGTTALESSLGIYTTSMAAAPAAAPVAAAPAATGGAGGLGAMAPALGVAAVAAFGLYMTYEMSKDKFPPLSELLNNAGIGPDAFSYAIGDTFKNGINPIFGTMEAFMMDAESMILTKSNTTLEGVKRASDGIQDVTMMHWDAAKGGWQDISRAAMAFKLGASAASIEAKMGIKGLGAELVNVSVAHATSLDKAIRSMSDMGIEGGDLKLVLDRVKDVISGVARNTNELEAELLGLGLASDQVDTVIKNLSLDTMQTTRNIGGMTVELNRFAGTAGNLDYGLYDLDTAMQGLADSSRDVGQAIESAVYDIRQGISDLRAGTGASAGSGAATVTVTGNANGGLLQGGSGVRDDIYLGRINGQVQLAKGGEYIINPESTRRHLSELERINADRYAVGGQTGKGTLPRIPDRPVNPPPHFDTTRHPANPDDLKELLELLGGVTEEMAKMGRSDFDNELASIRKEMAETYAEAKRLGASEQDLINIRQYESAQIAQLQAEHLKAQKEFMVNIEDQIAAFGMTDTELAIRDTVKAMEESIAAARELGLSETEIMKIRKLQQLQAEEILEQQRKAQKEFMVNIEDQIAAFGMTDQQKSLFENQRAMEAAIESAKELGLGESDLARVRELYGLKAAEIMNAGLKESLDAIKSFKESFAGVADEATKNATAQKELFDVLSQARAGDFSGVEKIGEVLGDISLDKSKYATAVDYARDYWKTMGAVNEIERLTKGRLKGVPATPNSSVAQDMQMSTNNTLAEISTSSAAAGYASKAAEDTAEVVTEIRNLRESLVAGNVQLTKNTNKVVKMLTRWEAIGLPVNSTYGYTEVAGVGTGTITRAA